MGQSRLSFFGSLACLEEKQFGYIEKEFPATALNTEPHCLWVSVHGTSRVLNTKDLVKIVDLTDLDRAFAIVEHVKPRRHPMDSHEVWRLDRVSLATGLFEVYDPVSGCARFLFGLSASGQPRYLHFGPKSENSVVLQQMIVPDNGPTSYQDVESGQTLPMTVIPATSDEDWSALASAAGLFDTAAL